MKRIPEQITFQPQYYGAWNGSLQYVTDDFRVALPTIVIDNDLPITIIDSIVEFDGTVTDTVSRPDSDPIMNNPLDIHTSKIINVIPNPMSDRADVTYSIVEPSVVTMKLINLLGVEVKTMMSEQYQDVGIFRHRIVADGLPNGVYILRLETISRGRREIAIEKVVVNR
jgi:hypothetical protein